MLKSFIGVTLPVLTLSFLLMTPLSAPATGAKPVTTQTQGKTVEMKSLSFDPKVLTIKLGESVTWKNVAFTNHTATADDKKSFDTGMVVPKATSKPIKFETAGTFRYHCTVHGQVMNGTIEVQQ